MKQKKKEKNFRYHKIYQDVTSLHRLWCDLIVTKCNNKFICWRLRKNMLRHSSLSEFIVFVIANQQQQQQLVVTRLAWSQVKKS